MAITPPGASSSSTATCATCLRKFTINFRRPYKDLAGEPLYNGLYGFDWLREEYYNPMLKMKNGLISKVYDNNMSVGVVDLKNSYKKGIKQINPHGIEYFPSTLSIFPEDIIKKKKYNKIPIEVTLSLEVHQIKGDDNPLELNDNTELEFKSNSSKLKFDLLSSGNFSTSKKIKLIDIIGGGQKNKTINLNNNEKFKYYKFNDAIKIKVTGAGIDQDGIIEVTALRSGKKELVGILNVLKNNKLKKAKYAIIHLLGDNNPINQILNLEQILKEQTLNQALVDVEIVKNESFDLRSHSNIADVKSFLTEFYQNRKTYSTGGTYVDKSKSSDFIERLIKIYENINNLNSKINSDQNDITYIFLTNVSMGEEIIDSAGNSTISAIEGSATLEPESGKSDDQWGNIMVMFHEGMKNTTTFLHELGHTFGLYHVFEDQNLDRFIMGHTDNMMDYEYHDNGFEEATALDQNSKFSNMQYSLYRWQWELINKDRSVRDAK